MENLRNRNGLWMEATIEFEETDENGVAKTKKERYVIEAASFMDGETSIRKEMEYNNRPIKVTAMAKPKYGTVCFNSNSDAENWYKIKVCVNEETDTFTRNGGIKTKIKSVSHYHLVQAANVDDARQAIKDVVYQNSVEDYEIADIVKTKIVDVLENGKHLQTLEVSE